MPRRRAITRSGHQATVAAPRWNVMVDSRAMTRSGAAGGATDARSAMAPVALWMWQIATASASAASCGDGIGVEPEQQLDHLLRPAASRRGRSRRPRA